MIRLRGLGCDVRLPLACAFLIALAGSAAAGDAYYVMVFGAQRTPPQPRYAHSFATFVHATWEGDGPCPDSPTLEARTISWLPANGIVRVVALAECGRNFELFETLHWARDSQQRVSMWGPYQIEQPFHDRSMRHKALLDSGQVLYKADDAGHRTDRVSNCIHAVSSAAEGYRLRVAQPGWGEMASYAIVMRFRPFIIDDEHIHTWIGSALGLDDYPIIYRDLESPRSGGIIIGPVNRLLGGEKNLQSTYGSPR
jgi:hypothetical protein